MLCVILILVCDHYHTILKPPPLLQAPTFVPILNAFDSLQLGVTEQLCETGVPEE